jgi:hypothetical protein
MIKLNHSIFLLIFLILLVIFTHIENNCLHNLQIDPNTKIHCKFTLFSLKKGF